MDWEIFLDNSYYHMWAVRPVGDVEFSSPRLFHMKTKEKAEALQELLNESDCAIPAKFI